MKTDGTVIIQEPPPMAVRGCQGLLRAWDVAAAGASSPGTVALRVAATTAQAAGTTIWASALPGQFVDFLPSALFPFYPLLLFFFGFFLCSFFSTKGQVYAVQLCPGAVFRFPSRAHCAAGAWPTGKAGKDNEPVRRAVKQVVTCFYE